MGKLLEIPEFKVKYSDVYSLRNLYIMLHEYLLEEGWHGVDGSKEGENVEILYSENVYQKGVHRGGKEMWVWWRLYKTPEGSYSNYFKNHLEIDMHMVYTQNVEAMHQGKKINVQKGEIEMFFRPWIESDIKGGWENHWFLRHFKEIYEKRILHDEIEKREKEIWRDTYRIREKIKQYLKLRNFMQVPEPMFARQFGFDGE